MCWYLFPESEELTIFNEIRRQNKHMSKNHAWESHRCGKVCVDDIIFSGWESAGRGNYNKVKGNAVSSHLCTLLFTFMNLGWLETHILQNKLFKSSQLTEPAPPVRTPSPVQWTVRPAATGHIYSNSRCVYSLSVLHSTLLSFTSFRHLVTQDRIFLKISSAHYAVMALMHIHVKQQSQKQKPEKFWHTVLM